MFSISPHSNALTRSINFSDLEKQLGQGAKLGVSMYLLGHDGRVIAQEGYESDRTLPMASTKKIAIALLVFKRILVENKFNLSDEIIFNDCDFVPGPPTNPLDQYFFNLSSDYPTQIRTIEELLILMLTKSDNSASDKLLNLVGGPVAVNAFISELGISGYNITRTSRQLLGDYYGITPEKSSNNCKLFLHELAIAYTIHKTEDVMFSAGEDCCTPQAMSQLICLLYSASTKADNLWVSVAANHICEIMKMCKTGVNRIRKGVSTLSDVEYIGNKTGSLGGIANDTAFIQFQDKQCAIVTIYTYLSPLSLEEREGVMARAAGLIVEQYRQAKSNAQPAFRSI